VKRIRAGTQSFTGNGPDKLPTILNKKLTIQRIQIQGEPHVRIKGTKTPLNHWNLRARVVAAPEPVVDGTRLRFDILKGNQVVPKALGLSAVAVAGTVAQTKVQPLVPGDIIEFQALIRMHLPTILDQISSTAQEIPLPVEFVVLDLE
jgi:hypothetical protein